jgi:hypothetical protein
VYCCIVVTRLDHPVGFDKDFCLVFLTLFPLCGFIGACENVGVESSIARSCDLEGSLFFNFFLFRDGPEAGGVLSFP